MNRLLRVALGFNPISLVHLAAGPREFLRSCSRAYAAARERPVIAQYQIPWVGLGAILADRRPEIRVTVMQHEDGMLPIDQLIALLSILVTESPREVLEIGTFMGHTTRQMADALPSATIHTVDLPESFSPEEDAEQRLPKDDFHLIRRRVVGREFREGDYGARIQQHFADTATWDFKDAGRPTFFFIDGSHTYEYCKNDSEKCFKVCEGRGVFLWHDCDDAHPGVQQFVAEWRAMGRDIRRISGTPLAYWKNV